MTLPTPYSVSEDSAATTVADVSPVAPSTVRLPRLWRFLVRWWWVPALTSVIGIVAGSVFFRVTHPTYVSTALLWETEKVRLPEGGLFAGDAQNYFGTQIELLRSRVLAEQAWERLREKGVKVADAQGKPIPAEISVLQMPRSSILIVEATSPDATFAQSYLSALLDQYADYNRTLRKTVSDDALASISDQVAHLGAELKADQEALTSFETSNNLAVLQEQGAVAAGYLAKLNTEYSDAQLEAKLLANAIEPSGIARQTNQEIPALSVGLDATKPSDGTDLNAAEREVALLKAERERLGQTFRPMHPRMIKLEAAIERAEKTSEILRQQNSQELAATREGLGSKLAELRTTIHEWESKVTAANAAIAQADGLKLNISRVQAAYDRYLGLLQTLDVSRNLGQDFLSVLQPASPAYFSPKRRQEQAAEIALAGLLAGLMGVAFIAWRDDRFTSVSEVTEKYKGNLLGYVPEMRQLKEAGTMSLVQVDDRRPAYAESYRNLRSALLFMPGLGESKVILVTSAMPHEGKSTIAANLARTLALGGARTLLIDGDLRQGYLHQLMEMRREPGFADLLRGSAGAPDVIQTNCMPNLSFISRGCDFGRPGDLFVGGALSSVLGTLREQFDHIVIDTSPVFAADDASTLAPRVDGTIFVVRSRVSRSGMVQEALELLHRRRARVLGVVANGAEANAKSYYCYNHPEYFRSGDGAVA